MFQEAMKDKIEEVRGMRRDDILAALGLARRRSLQNDWLPAVGLFAAGIAVGTGIALLLAPKSGREMRRELRGRASDVTRRVGGVARDVRSTLEEGKESVAPHSREPTENGARDWRLAADRPIPTK